MNKFRCQVRGCRAAPTTFGSNSFLKPTWFGLSIHGCTLESVDSPTPRGLPPFVSSLYWKMPPSSCAALMTRESMLNGKPGRVTALIPVKLCTAGLNSPVVLWWSAGGSNFSFYEEVKVGTLVQEIFCIYQCKVRLYVIPRPPVVPGHCSKAVIVISRSTGVKHSILESTFSNWN